MHQNVQDVNSCHTMNPAKYRSPYPSSEQPEVIGTFSAATGQLNFDTAPYWQFGRLDSFNVPELNGKSIANIHTTIILPSGNLITIENGLV